MSIYHIVGYTHHSALGNCMLVYSASEYIGKAVYTYYVCKGDSKIQVSF